MTFSNSPSARQPVSTRLTVRGDPRVSMTDEDRRVHADAARRVYDAQKKGIPTNNRASSLNTQMTALTKSLNDVKNAPADTKTAAEEMAKKIRDVQGRVSRAMQPINSGARELAASTSRPTDAQLQQIASGIAQLERVLPQIDALTSGDVPAFNQKLDAASLPASVARLKVN